MDEQKQPIEMWAKVELMGHVTLAGKVSEAPMFGTALMRVDVPETDAMPAHTEFFGGNAIYRITPCGEAEARLLAANFITRQPIQPYMLKQLREPFGPAQLALGRGDAAQFVDGDDDDEDEDGIF